MKTKFTDFLNESFFRKDKISFYNNDFTNEKKAGDYGIGLDIKKEYTKIIDGGKGGTLDLGVVDAVSDTVIKNMKKKEQLKS